jgi:hypothetical protein
MSVEDKASTTSPTSTSTASAMSPSNNHQHHILGPLGSSSPAGATATAPSTPVHHNSNNVISNWMSWTLGRGEKKSKVSHPIPQHELKNGNSTSGLLLLNAGGGKSTAAGTVPVASTFYTPDVTESSSSSASLTPSPKYTASSGGGGGSLWNPAASHQKNGIRNENPSVLDYLVSSQLKMILIFGA